MNKIIRNEKNEYILTLTNGDKFTCSRWFEKKTDKWHIVVPKEAREICGRTYIRESYFDHSDIYEFEDKLEHRTGLTSGGWRAKMTDDEKKLVEEAERTIERIKSECMAREVKKVEKNSEEWYVQEIAKLTAKLEAQRAKK